MKLLAAAAAADSSLVDLEVLALDTGIAGRAQRPIALMVVLGAVRAILQYVKVGGLKWGAALVAHEARLVVAASESAVC